MEDGANIVNPEKKMVWFGDKMVESVEGEEEPHLTALGSGWKTVPACLPFMIPGMACGSLDEQMTMVQPAAVAILAAVNFVTIPPVPHLESAPLVSTCTALVWQDRQLPVRSAEPAYLARRLGLDEHARADCRSALCSAADGMSRVYHWALTSNMHLHGTKPKHVNIHGHVSPTGGSDILHAGISLHAEAMLRVYSQR